MDIGTLAAWGEFLGGGWSPGAHESPIWNARLRASWAAPTRSPLTVAERPATPRPKAPQPARIPWRTLSQLASLYATARASSR
jgi:hypothetical protein